MAGGFYKFKNSDIEGLSLMLSHMQRQQSFYKRCRMVLACLANTWEDPARAPVPFFSMGRRALADLLGETPRACQMFLETMERDGWIVRVGTETNKGGRFTLRSFFWMTEGAERQEQQKAFRGAERKSVPPLAENPAKNVPGGERCARKKRSTSEIPEGISEVAGVAAAGAAPRLAEELVTHSSFWRSVTVDGREETGDGR